MCLGSTKISTPLRSTKRSKALPGATLSVSFRSVTGDLGSGAKATLGLLFIPRRGPPAYAKDQFYMRERDSCRPAATSEDYEFQFSNRRRRVSEFAASAARRLRITSR